MFFVSNRREFFWSVQVIFAQIAKLLNVSIYTISIEICTIDNHYTTLNIFLFHYYVQLVMNKKLKNDSLKAPIRSGVLSHRVLHLKIIFPVETFTDG